MALIKVKETKFGISASYWRVETCVINNRLKEASFVLGLYIDKSGQESFEDYFVTDLMGQEDKTLYEKYFNDIGKTYKDWQTACYMYAKEHVEFFKDAVDDPEELALR